MANGAYTALYVPIRNKNPNKGGFLRHRFHLGNKMRLSGTLRPGEKYRWRQIQMPGSLPPSFVLLTEACKWCPYLKLSCLQACKVPLGIEKCWPSSAGSHSEVFFLNVVPYSLILLHLFLLEHYPINLLRTLVPYRWAYKENLSELPMQWIWPCPSALKNIMRQYFVFGLPPPPFGLCWFMRNPPRMLIRRSNHSGHLILMCASHYCWPFRVHCLHTLVRAATQNWLYKESREWGKHRWGMLWKKSL